MKLSDFVFRDIHFFIDTFVDPKNTESLKILVDRLQIYKWGISESGHSGRIILSCSSSADIQKSSTMESVPETWTLFFAFLPEGESYKEILSGFDYISEIWSEGSSFFRCGGFEVAASRREFLAELIYSANEF